jgi:hypothetical protein
MQFHVFQFQLVTWNLAPYQEQPGITIPTLPIYFPSESLHIL